MDAIFSPTVGLTWLATSPATFATLLATPPRLPTIPGGRETSTAARTPRVRPRVSTRPQRIRRPGPLAARGARGALIFGTFIGLAAATAVSFIRGAETLGCLGCFGGLGCFGCDMRGAPTRTCGRKVAIRPTAEASPLGPAVCGTGAGVWADGFTHSTGAGM